MPSPSGIAQGLSDPLGTMLHLLTGVLGQVVSTARADLNTELTKYLFTTVDPTSSGLRPLTSNPTVTHLNATMAVAADILVGAVVVFASLRSMFEHNNLRARYTLKLVLPRLLVAIALVHGSIYFMQMAIDLNNAIGGVAVSLGDPLTPGTLPWSSTFDPASVQAIQVSQDLFHAIFAVALLVALVILVLSYVIRTALLEILIVIAPLAALCSVLPDTKGYARLWLRLFVVTVFMQAVQLIVLRVATATAFSSGDGVAQSLYALATLWIMLKVPSTLHTASHFESRAQTLGRHVERSVRRAIAPVHHAVHHRVSA
jgi:hypothetical protein